MLREKAIHYATEKHKGQKRIDGSPYIYHPIRVAMIVEKFKESHELESLVAAALLHDVLEDSDATFKEIENEFGFLVASLVQELTSNKEEQKKVGKAKYLGNKMLHMSNWALVLKLCDRADNVKDLIHSTPSFEKKYIEETKEIIDILEKGRELTKTQKELVKRIKELY